MVAIFFEPQSVNKKTSYLILKMIFINIKENIQTTISTGRNKLFLQPGELSNNFPFTLHTHTHTHKP